MFSMKLPPEVLEVLKSLNPLNLSRVIVSRPAQANLLEFIKDNLVPLLLC
jgi:hypothetical protein